jgi:hypothetical protein
VGGVGLRAELGINFDQFYFIPSRDYPMSGLGGAIERVEDWAYVHE